MAGCQGSLTMALLLLPAALWQAVASEEARELSSGTIHMDTGSLGTAAPAGSAHPLAEASWEGHVLGHPLSIPTAAPAAVTKAPVPTPAATTAPVPTPAPPVVPAGPGSSGKPHLGLNSLGYETIPRHIKLKYKLIQWFENQRQCPLNMEGGFPAWVGWKAVTAATPAITTPPKGVAGNRTLIVDGFCPNMRSSNFKCVRTGNEIKARATTRTAHLALDNVRCTMQDISLYRMEDGFVGVRFDFASCGGNSHIGALAPHVPQSASLNMGLAQQRVGQASVNFNEFFNAVCNDGPAADFATALLPKFARGAPATGLPSCFAETANTAHVIGKGCYEDFIFFEMEDMNGQLATIPTTDLQALSKMIPDSQQYSHHAARPAPAPVPASAMMSVPVAQAPGQVLTAPSNPYQKPTCSQYQCQAPFSARPDPDMYLCHEQSGCTVGDRTVCCLIPTTTTTTPATVEVPGVVVAYRVCLFFQKCGCNNLCDCSTQSELGRRLSVAAVTPGPLPIVEPICKDHPRENLIIAFLAFVVSVPTTIFMLERCVRPSFSKSSTIVAPLLDNTEVKCDAHVQSWYSMMVVLFFMCMLVTGVAVHGVYWIYDLVLTNVFNIKGDDIWNGLELMPNCYLSLCPVWVALWLMTWLCTSYFRVSDVEKPRRKEVAM